MYLISICVVENMVLSYLVAVISANMMIIQSHDCNDYDKLASDQCLIDMMKHCLNTCIKPAASAAGMYECYPTRNFIVSY